MPYYPPAASGSGYTTIQDETTPITQRTTMNFAGAGVTAADSGGVSTITIPGGAGASWTELEVDFGTRPVWDARFTVVDGTVGAASKVICVQSGNVPTGMTGGDGEWDAITYAALPAVGSFTLMSSASPGPIMGTRKLYYTVA